MKCFLKKSEFTTIFVDKNSEINFTYYNVGGLFNIQIG